MGRHRRSQGHLLPFRCPADPDLLAVVQAVRRPGLVLDNVGLRLDVCSPLRVPKLVLVSSPPPPNRARVMDVMQVFEDRRSGLGGLISVTMSAPPPKNVFLLSFVSFRVFPSMFSNFSFWFFHSLHFPYLILMKLAFTIVRVTF